MAEAYELRAAWQSERGKSARDDIAKGLEAAEKALSRSPRMAAALATKGALYLLAARAAREPSDRAEAARKAKEAQAAAIRENPLLERERRPSLEEAERLRERAEDPR